jgi:Ca2+/H+ antiporter, TMEM165/GDT1 family
LQLKYAVGVVLSSFGVFFLGEGLGVRWPGDDVALLYIAVAFVAAAHAQVAAVAARHAEAEAPA